MGEGASRLLTGLQTFKGEPGKQAGSREEGGSGAAEAGEEMALEAAILRDLVRAAQGSRTRMGRPPTDKAEMGSGSGAELRGPEHSGKLDGKVIIEVILK